MSRIARRVPRPRVAGAFLRRGARSLPLALAVFIAAGCSTIVPISDEPALSAPPAPGQSRFLVAGCLSTRSETKGLSSARRRTGDGVAIRALAGGVVVTHQVTHLCCLEGSSQVSIIGQVATVRERLVGEPCKCKCKSTLETVVGLAPGRWTIRVLLEDASHELLVDERRVEVSPARSAK